jgi:putative transposase
MRCRRAREAGATYFFTLNLAERKHTLLTDNADILRAAIQGVRQKYPFRIDALVILPDHLHTIWTLPPGDADFATRWMLIKSGFSRHITPGERRSSSRVSKGE